HNIILAVMHRFASSIVLCLCFGCTMSRPVISDEADRAITDSVSFRRAHAISPTRDRWFVDGSDGMYPVIYVGYDMGTHYTRSATLRLRELGFIERQEMREDGELIWIPDK